MSQSSDVTSLVWLSAVLLPCHSYVERLCAASASVAPPCVRSATQGRQCGRVRALRSYRCFLLLQRYSKQGRDAAVTSQAPAAATNTVRKTVRFSSDAKAASPDTSYEQLDVSSLATVHTASVPHIATPYTDFASVRSHAGMPLSSLPDTGSLRRTSQDVATVTLRGASANELDSLV